MSKFSIHSNYDHAHRTSHEVGRSPVKQGKDKYDRLSPYTCSRNMHMEEELNVGWVKNQEDTQYGVKILRNTGIENPVKLNVLTRKSKRVFRSCGEEEISKIWRRTFFSIRHLVREKEGDLQTNGFCKGTGP